MSSKTPKQLIQRQLISKQQEKHARKMLELEKKRTEMSKENNRMEIDLLNEEFNFAQMKMSALNEIINSLAEKNNLEEFRSECLKLVRKFEKFKSLFDEENALFILKVEDSKSHPKHFNNLDILADITDALQAFSGDVQSLRIIFDKELTVNYQKLQLEVLEKSEEVRNEIDELYMALENYNRKMAKKRNPKNLDVIKGLFVSSENFIRELKHLVEKSKQADKANDQEDPTNILLHLNKIILTLTSVIHKYNEDEDKMLAIMLISDMKGLYADLEKYLEDDEDGLISKIRDLLTSIFELTDEF